MTTTTMAPRGRWIPWVFVAGFGLVVAVNAVLITAAVRTFTGTTTSGAYNRGLDYGEVLAEAQRQRVLGWSGRISRGEGAVLVALRGPDSTPLPADALVAGRLQRPLERLSLPLDFAPAGPGSWRAAAEVPAPGAWEAVLIVTRGGDRFELRERLVFP